MQMKHFAGLLVRFVVSTTVAELEAHFRVCVKQPQGHLGIHPRAFSCSSSSQIISFEPLFSCMRAQAAPRFHQKCSLAAFHVVLFIL